MVSAALAGIHGAESDALRAAARVASGDTDDLAGDLVGLQSAERRHAANIRVLESAMETEQNVLDILA
ncbi:MAG: hypothetical protein JSS66_09490 [Armatimonadetes bacterium]|nr:hypothetical protein [Armatimonadota bacterium]